MKSRRAIKNYVLTSIVGLALCIIGTGFGGAAQAADWPNWRGPNLNGISDETGWTAVWPAEGPKILWQEAIGTGFSSMAVSKGRLYAMGNIDNQDILYCFNAETGQLHWKKSYSEPKNPKNYEGGPNATPTVDGNKVYTFSKTGKLFCRDTQTGDVVWSKDLKQEFGIKSPDWGISGSALILGDMVILNAGTWGIAFDKTSGKLVWETGKGPGGYGTPVPYTSNGRTYLAVFGEETIAGVDAQTGKKVWDYPWKTRYNVNAADPIVSGDMIFISSGYGKGCALLKLEDNSVTEIYNNKNMRNQCNSSVLWKGCIYGFDGQVGGKGKLTCIDHKSSKVKWSQAGLGTGSLMLADGKLIVLGEKGKLAIFEARPDGYKELAAAQILPKKKCWTTPVLANGLIYARNADGDLVCVDVRARAAAAKAGGNPGGVNWPRFRGPNGDGKSPETGLLKSWPEQGPPLAWQINGLGDGFSTIAIADGKFYTMGDLKVGDDDEKRKQFVVAFDLATRQRLWDAKVGERWKTGKGGPRCTPTIDGDLLYAIGTHGDVVCLETATGKEVWRKNFDKHFGGKMMSKWGFSESPLVDGDKVLCTPGGKDAAIVALNKKTGETVWKAAVPNIGKRGKDGAGYGSIVVAEIGGIRQYIQMMGRGVVAVADDDGRFLWGYNKVANDVANIPMVVVDGDHVFCTTSYKTGSALLKIVPSGGGLNVEEIYFLGPEEFENHHGGVVLLDGYIYGGDGQNKGALVCLEMKTGRIAWKEDPLGKGSAALLYADGHLYYRYQNGLMTLVEATPTGLNVRGSFMLDTIGKYSWPHPVIHDRKLYLRDNDTLMCYDISAYGIRWTLSYSAASPSAPGKRCLPTEIVWIASV
ncbi:MAG: outer membrane protein assembly factor BamB family protein [Planctomycetota bacterium]|jgi:outer membrane protein assembly factor BamB